MTTRVKVVLCGAIESGKTTFVQTLLGKKVTTYIPTIGVDFSAKQINETLFCLWDTSGESKYAPIMRTYLRGTDVVTLCYDKTKIDSYKQIHSYLEPIQNIPLKYIFSMELSNNPTEINDQIVKEKLNKHGFRFVCMNPHSKESITNFMQHLSNTCKHLNIGRKNNNIAALRDESYCPCM